MLSRGLIIGKFLPLHKGHQFLIETALADVDELAVVIFDNHKFSIPGPVRERWIKTLYPQATVLLLRDSGHDYQTPAAWEEHGRLLRQNIARKPDVVFSSESYGDKVAALFGARHVLVDHDRTRFSVSGSEILKNPGNYRQFLDPLVFDELGHLL